MKLFDKIKGLMKRKAKAPDGSTAKVIVHSTERGETARKRPKSYMGKQWAALREDRIRRGLPVSGETRRALRAKMSRKPRRSRRAA